MRAGRKLVTVGLGLNLAWVTACKDRNVDPGLQYPPLTPVHLDFADGRPRDSINTVLWKDYLQGRKLFEAWSPVPGSPWVPYAKATLFSALDEIDGAAKPIYDPDDRTAEAQAQNFARHRKVPNDTLILIDLPGGQSVAWGAVLAREQSLQPVPTFNNWPHQRGVLKAERVLGALIYYAAEIAQLKREGKLTQTARPVFLMDSNRLGLTQKVKDTDFDNRYYLVASDLPAAGDLKGAGIQHILYIVPDDRVSQEQDDLNQYFIDLRKSGIDFAIISAQRFTDESQIMAAQKEKERSSHTSYHFLPWWFFYHSGRAYGPMRRPTLFTGGGGTAGQFIRAAGGGFGGYHGIQSGGGG